MWESDRVKFVQQSLKAKTERAREKKTERRETAESMCMCPPEQNRTSLGKGEGFALLLYIEQSLFVCGALRLSFIAVFRRFFWPGPILCPSGPSLAARPLSKALGASWDPCIFDCSAPLFLIVSLSALPLLPYDRQWPSVCLHRPGLPPLFGSASLFPSPALSLAVLCLDRSLCFFFWEGSLPSFHRPFPALSPAGAISMNRSLLRRWPPLATGAVSQIMTANQRSSTSVGGLSRWPYRWSRSSGAHCGARLSGFQQLSTESLAADETEPVLTKIQQWIPPFHSVCCYYVDSPVW